MWEDQAASGNFATVVDIGSNRLPTPDLSAPLETAHRTCTNKPAPRLNHRICCGLFIRRLARKFALPSVTEGA